MANGEQNDNYELHFYNVGIEMKTHAGWIEPVWETKETEQEIKDREYVHKKRKKFCKKNWLVCYFLTVVFILLMITLGCILTYFVQLDSIGQSILGLILGMLCIMFFMYVENKTLSKNSRIITYKGKDYY